MRIAGLIMLVALAGCTVRGATERGSGVGFGTTGTPANTAAPAAAGPTDYRGQMMQDLASG